MRSNKLKQVWRDGGYTVNGWLHIPSSWSAEVMAHAGWDSITIDLQHGFADLESTLAMLQAISTTDTVPLVRASWNDPLQIQRVLDAGAYGVICPVVNDAAECARFVGACRYPPLGYRSLGPTRAKLYAGDDYATYANETVATFAMVETAEGVRNLDEILAVPGLDGVFVGPGDLALTMAVSADGADASQVDATIAHIAERTLAAGKVPGIWCASADVAIIRRRQGYRFLTIASDARLMAQAARSAVAAVRAAGGEA